MKVDFVGLEAGAMIVVECIGSVRRQSTGRARGVTRKVWLCKCRKCGVNQALTSDRISHGMRCNNRQCVSGAADRRLIESWQYELEASVRIRGLLAS
jgi:hypothetical protein